MPKDLKRALSFASIPDSSVPMALDAMLMPLYSTVALLFFRETAEYPGLSDLMNFT